MVASIKTSGMYNISDITNLLHKKIKSMVVCAPDLNQYHFSDAKKIAFSFNYFASLISDDFFFKFLLKN